MKKLFAAMLIMVIGIVLIPVVQNSVDSYDSLSTDETFTAASNSSTAEDFTIAETPTSVDAVTVNGTALTLTTDYTVSGSTISLLAASSDTGDTVVVQYTYDYDMPTGIDNLVDVVLIMFVIGVVVGGVAYIKMN